MALVPFITEDFSGTAGNSLQDYSASWVAHPNSVGTIGIVTPSYTAARASSAVNSLYRHTTATPSADYSVTGTFIRPYAGTAYGGICARLSSSAATFYMARYATLEGQLQLYKFVSGAVTLLGSSGSTLPINTPRTLRLEVIGSAIKAYENGSSTASISATDSAISAAGFAGIRLNESSLDLDSLVAEYESGGGATHTVTARAVAQATTVTRPGLTQTHVATASAVAQGATVSRPLVTQTHVVTARPVAQGSTVNAPAVEVGSITVVTARPVVQSSTVNAPSIVQTHIVIARPAAQGVTVTRPGLTQTHTVTARAVTQGSVVNAPSVDVGSTPATVVTALPVAQGSTVNAPGIRQTHVTSARAVVQGSTINVPGLVQTHVVTARAVVQAGSVNKPWVTTGSGTFTGLSPADLAAIRAAVRAELHAELTAIFQIQTKVDTAL